ncbi:MAG: transposase [Myxococcales bacterium FL481]|nr:MAG: transposase [Myxococcales bacterium FL481]
MPRKKRRTFTPEQRQEAVRVLEKLGKTVASVAEDLGISPSVLGRCSRKYGSGRRTVSTATHSVGDDDEVERLRRENRTLR